MYQPNGDVAEWLKAHDCYPCKGKHLRGFESLRLRHIYSEGSHNGIATVLKTVGLAACRGSSPLPSAMLT